VTCRPAAGGGVVCGPTKVIEVSRKEKGIHWCFVCRQRVPFFFVVRRDDVEEDYYGPWMSVEDEKGHINGDLFPGRERVWEG
jgi:hypothetical protein